MNAQHFDLRVPSARMSLIAEHIVVQGGKYETDVSIIVMLILYLMCATIQCATSTRKIYISARDDIIWQQTFEGVDDKS